MLSHGLGNRCLNPIRLRGRSKNTDKTARHAENGDIMINWFVCINDGHTELVKHVKAAILSAEPYKNIVKHCVYDGKDKTMLDFLASHNVNVIRHRFSGIDVLNRIYGHSSGHLRISSGAFLRIDIPELIEKHKIGCDYYLYTDVDIMFRRDLSDLEKLTPAYLCGAPEMHQENTSYFNSGSLWCNTKGLLNSIDECRKIIHDPAYDGKHHDQGVLNTVYKKRFDPLPLSYNWKPYWGINEDAHIVHWHGPKPYHVMKNQLRGVLTTLYNKNPNSYDFYISEYRRWASGPLSPF